MYLKSPRRRREKNLYSKTCMRRYRCVPKIASPEARKKIYIVKHVCEDIVVYLKSPRRRREKKFRWENVHEDIVVYLKWPRRRREKKLLPKIIRNQHRPKTPWDQVSGPANSSKGKVLYSTTQAQNSMGPSFGAV